MDADCMWQRSQSLTGSIQFSERQSGLLRQETVRVIDEREDGDSPLLALSNFSAREDRETSEIVVNMSRLFERSPPEPERDWTSDAYLYRVRVK